MDDIQKLVTKKCATYAGKKQCFLDTDDEGGTTCVYFMEDKKKRCPYFEKSVLPEDAELEKRYHESPGSSTKQKATCIRCKKEFMKNSNAQKRCENCQDTKSKSIRKAQNERNYERQK